MSRKIDRLISILLPTYKKGKRRNFTMKNKEQVISKQKGKCAICRGYLNRWERDFHHKDGNRSNNDSSNCQAAHTRCHRKKHAEERCNKQKLSLLKL